jgi:hypothetical protein
MASGPGYTVQDLVFYSGFIGGIIVTYLGLQALELDWPQIVYLILGLVVGAGLGWLALFLFERIRRGPSGPRRRSPYDEDDPY